MDVVLGEHGDLLDVDRRTRATYMHIISTGAECGPTKLGNLVLVCSTHHRMIHEGALGVKLQPDESPACERVSFVDQHDRAIPRFPSTSAKLDELEHWLREADVHIAR